jgi:UDP-N-acetylglucosamine--N-acetylmuramyl-(pentapeptide) pyrophosphoryl-undecaprenol N-acetylglucosamine transferase
MNPKQMNQNRMKLHKVIISGGGTGGHIFPAIAVADALKRISPSVEILFVGALGKMEMQKVPAAGYRIIGLDITGLQRKISVSNLLFPFRLIKSYFKARAIIREFRPQVVLGTGGFASGPLLYAATGMGIPSIIQEQNSYPGITNRSLGKRVKRVCVAYPGLEEFFESEKIILTGNPVRYDIENNKWSREDATRHFGLNPERPVILVYGGSLGALAINQGTLNALKSWSENGYQLIWQTGNPFFAQAETAVKNGYSETVRVMPFIDKMDAAYAAADLVVGRAGAIAVSELCLNGKPSILVPLPTAAEDHQTKNARALEVRNAAVLLPNQSAPTALAEFVTKLMNDEKRRDELSDNIAAMAVRNSADSIVNEMLSII